MNSFYKFSLHVNTKHFWFYKHIDYQSMHTANSALLSSIARNEPDRVTA